MAPRPLVLDARGAEPEPEPDLEDGVAAGADGERLDARLHVRPLPLHHDLGAVRQGDQALVPVDRVGPEGDAGGVPEGHSAGHVVRVCDER